MLSPLLLPVDWFVDYEPPWLGIAVMLIGLVCVMTSYVWSVQVQKSAGYYLLYFLVLGLAAYPWFRTYPQPFVLLLTFVGSWFQGVGIVRGYLKLVHYAKKVKHAMINWLTSSDSADRAGGDSTRDHARRGIQKVSWILLFQLLGLLAVTTSVWIGVGLTVYGDLTLESLTTDIVIVWTLITLSGSILGLTWRFWTVRGSLPLLLMLGIVLLAAGAELQNLRSLRTELLFFIINKAIFALAFIAAVALFIIKRNVTTPSSTSRGT
jgi:hypothetical protein